MLLLHCGPTKIVGALLLVGVNQPLIGLDHFSFFFSRALAQRAVTAFRAIAWRCSGVIFWSRALPPFRPNATAFGSFCFFAISAADVISAIRRNQQELDHTKRLVYTQRLVGRFE